MAVSPEAKTWTTRPILFMQLSFQLLWVTGATLGGLLGEALPIERLRGPGLRADRAVHRAGHRRLQAAAGPADRGQRGGLRGGWRGCWCPGQMLVCAFAAFTGVLLARLRVERRPCLSCR